MIKTFGWVENITNLSTVRECIDLFPDDITTESEMLEILSAPANPWNQKCILIACQALGLTKIRREYEGYELTELGHRLKTTAKNEQPDSGHRPLTGAEIRVFREAMLGHPPVVRVLQILNERAGKYLCKYDIGEQLGFIGDAGGFTHLSAAWVRSTGSSPANAEGDCDRYARTFTRWLEQVGWVEASGIPVDPNAPRRRWQHWRITPEGRRMHLTTAQSSTKRMCLEMLCSGKHPHKDLVRRRRGLLIRYLQDNRRCPRGEIVDALELFITNINEDIVELDVQSLRNAGVDIRVTHGNYHLHERRLDLDFPNDEVLRLEVPISEQDETEELIAKAHECYPHVALTILDGMIRYSRDGKRNREFESTVYEYFVSVGYKAQQLGGSGRREADTLAWYQHPTRPRRSYGLIIDAKSTSNPAYTLPSPDERAMIEYVRHHESTFYGRSIPNISFVFLSKDFSSGCEEKLSNIRSQTDIRGCLLPVESALYLAEKLHTETDLSLETLKNLYNCMRKITTGQVDRIVLRVKNGG